MKEKLKLVRQVYDVQGTTGKLYNKDGLFCYTLERPKTGEHPCIEEGEYKVVPDQTGKFRYFKVINVPKRENIEIHPINCIDDSLGCIGVGNKISSKIGKYKFWLHNSKPSCLKLKDKYPEGFSLIITNVDKECTYAKN